MSGQPETPAKAAGRDRELTDAEIQDVLRSSRRYGRRRRAAIEALELAGPTKLKAQSKLWKQAANAVLEKWPRDCDDLEQVIWPAFSEYSETVFDKIAGNRSESLASKFSLRRYVHWLRYTCIAAVIEEDVCPPGGQFYATVQHVIGVVGEARRPNQIDAAKRALYRLLAEFLGGPYTQNLEKRLRTHLNGRAAHWEGEAMERISALLPAKTTATLGSTPPAPANSATVANMHRLENVERSVKGANIDKLRKECGWSLSELAAKTGLDKKLTLGHVNKGKGIRPITLKMYADAFAKKLNRPVTVAELEG